MRWVYPLMGNELGHKALQQQTLRDPKYNNNNKNNKNNKKNYLYLAATRFMTSLKCLLCSVTRRKTASWSGRVPKSNYLESCVCYLGVSYLSLLGGGYNNNNNNSNNNDKAAK
ncbi:unnamed protein product [Polarella glacialis]|uniref:Uncharacterized protein n=1 Tax=Polarella glacialis TaxID=89957 RepID=A0A813HKF9_POLGL|nr:unnamed protein product [Polarella glacialis]